MNDKYILDEHGEPVPCEDLMKWASQFEQDWERRIVKQEQIGDSKVSTVFLGLDHGFGKGDPVLWETMIFGGERDQEMHRCSGSREQAEAMHYKTAQSVRASLPSATD